ncbi:MAG TPA: SDR family oxidoreductase [Oscillatoriaceae cyanobacterium M33_DOE_052]|uniref:SDR family oxidoreductase n=1 Tax=Planktothricoides sp. SpSt-374 TaxID=2282167 RepID=A0A7C3ZV83_9CYAN|nr:SDR family oxidoreductase [Oscillatoriaceae cyanobacterium M33_DOE_052]
MATYLVTGANRGIGLELCRHLQARGETVIAVCRQNSPKLDSLGIQVVMGIDVSSDAAVASLANNLQGITIDVLINNAGILAAESLENLNFEGIRRQFEINSLGPLRVTAALLPQMPPGGKIAIITSRMGSIGDNSSGGYYGYRMSKVAANMVGMSLARDLKPRQIAVAILHPGLVNTSMTNTGIPPAEAASGLIARIDELNLENTGTFWHANGEILPW